MGKIVVWLTVVLLGCGVAGAGMWQDWTDKQVKVPARLSAPKDAEWRGKLQTILSEEKLTLVQYAHNRDKYKVVMPYKTIIPQEYNHVRWLEQLLAAYGLKAKLGEKAVTKVAPSTTLAEALRDDRQLEVDLIVRYQWLIKHAPDSASRDLLGTLLLQTRIHYVLFDHALAMM